MCILVELDDTFSEEHSLEEPSIAEFSEVSPHIELHDPISDESSLELAPTLVLSSLASPLPILHPSLDSPESTLVGSETFMLGSSCLDQTLDDSDIKRLEDYFEVKDLTLGSPMSLDFLVLFD